jgi:acyl-CoA thioesterase FadM
VAEAFRIEYRVTWADTDAAGVVNFSRYFLFFERCEEEFSISNLKTLILLSFSVCAGLPYL